MFFRSVLTILQTILYGWIVALVHLIRALLRLTARDGRSERDKRASRSPCVPIDDPAFVRPDPLLYSQQYMKAHGLAVTWDNPDIRLFHNGLPVPSHELAVDTIYDVQARIWNDSFDAPVFNMAVHLSYLDFGIGTTPLAIGTRTVDVGVKGGPNHPAFVTIPWHTPNQAGHYCLQVLLDPFDDRDSSNNLGQENTDVGVAQSPVAFRFTLRNPTGRAHRYRFEIDAYQLGDRPPCRNGEMVVRDRRARLARHRDGQHPLPANFQVDINPATPVLVPGEAIPIDVTITAPDGYVGEQPVNINAFDERGLAGGVTLIVVGEV